MAPKNSRDMIAGLRREGLSTGEIASRIGASLAELAELESAPKGMPASQLMRRLVHFYCNHCPA